MLLLSLCWCPTALSAGAIGVRLGKHTEGSSCRLVDLKQDEDQS